MRHCINCQFHTRGVVDTPMGPQTADLCTHLECADPVNGQALPCAMTRREIVFCGFNAKYFKEKQNEERKSVIALVSNAPRGDSTGSNTKRTQPEPVGDEGGGVGSPPESA